jgi:hypothetical protein
MDYFTGSFLIPTIDPNVAVYIDRATPGSTVYVQVGRDMMHTTSFNAYELDADDAVAAKQVLHWYLGWSKASALGLSSQLSRRYGVVEMATGYVWWAGYASSAEEACVKAQAESLDEPAEFVPCFKHGDPTYTVYRIDALLKVDDGQDQHTINAVSACPLAGFYRIV